MGISFRFFPSKFNVPEIIYPLFPDRTFAKVLLPEPLGPITACNSPGFILKFRPLRINLLFIDTCKFLISNIIQHFPLN